MKINAQWIVAALLLSITPLFFGSSLSLAQSGASTELPLTRLLNAELARFPAKSGVYVKHLKSGEEAGVLVDDHFESASTIKIATMVLAYQMAEAGQLDLNERVELRASDLRGGSGIYRYKDLGLSPTVRDLITEMIITSDNTATDIMIAKVGGKEEINAFLERSGYSVLRQIRTTFEFFSFLYAVIDPKYGELPPEELFALCCAKIANDPAFFEKRQQLLDQSISDSAGRDILARQIQLAEDEENWFGAASPREMGRLLESIELCSVASEESCDEMQRILLSQQVGPHKIPHYLDVPVGHKTGDIFDVTNDVGIVYAQSGPIIISFFNMSVVGPRADTEDRMGRVVRMVVDYFDGKSD